jgi:hypothetical protein
MTRKTRSRKGKSRTTKGQSGIQRTGDVPIKAENSLGALRKAQKAKPRSPDATGTLYLQRHTLKAIVKDLEENCGDEVICNIAAWKNQDQYGPFLSVEISPRFVPHEQRMPQPSIFDDIVNDQDE